MVNLRRSSNAEQAEVTETFPRSSRERGLSRSPSSNRTCRFPASGSPTRVVRRPTQGVDGRSSQGGEPIALQTRIETLALSKRTTTPLAPIPEKAPETSPHEVVQCAESLPGVAVPKVGRPPAQQRVHRGEGVRERVFRARPGQPSHFLSHARLRPLRGSHRQIAAGARQTGPPGTQPRSHKKPNLVRPADSHHSLPRS